MQSCVIFDFDGVIADTEELHFAGFNAALAASAAAIGGSLVIGHGQYTERYMPYGDYEAFYHMLQDNGRPLDEAVIADLISLKSREMERLLASVADPLPGVRNAIAFLDRMHVPLAICSSARGAEVRQVLDACSLTEHFEAIIGIEEVTRSKPDPEGYSTAFGRLSQRHGNTLTLNCSLAIEDSAGGADAARAAGLRVLGVATNLPLDTIASHSTWSVASLENVTEDQWRSWLAL